MIYTKTQLSENIEIKVNIYGDELYCNCPDCGKESKVEFELLLVVLKEGADFSSSPVCKECAEALYQNELEVERNEKAAAVGATVKCLMKHCDESGTLILENGKMICESCAQIQSELAP